MGYKIEIGGIKVKNFKAVENYYSWTHVIGTPIIWKII